jgi:membrane protein YqaA with SNARE-associated domain
MQNLMVQIVAIIGILLAIVTGVGNIFSAPEFSFGGQNPWLHLAAHVFIGTTVGSLVPWAIGSLILAVTRKMSPSPQTA